MTTTPYNTNLASELWVLSALHRIGVEAFLSLGNKKSVDILVRTDSKTYTVEVKGLVKRYDWPADNIKEFYDPNHVYILLTYNGKISDPSVTPDVWIIPAKEMKQFIKEYATRTVVSRSLVVNTGKRYHNNWGYFFSQ